MALAFLSIAIFAKSDALAQVRIYAPVDSVDIGARFTIQIVVEHSPDSDLLVPEPDSLGSTLGDIELIELLKHPTRNETRGGRVVRIDSAVYTAAAFAVDSAYVPPLSVKIVGADTVEYQTPTIYIPVKRNVPKDSKEMMDIAPLATFPWPWWTYALVALTLLLVIGAIYYYFVKRKNEEVVEEKPVESEIPLDPYEHAMARLRLLEAQDLTSSTSVKPFYVELSETVREFIDHRLAIPALEQTSGDLIRNVERHSKRGGRVSGKSLELLKPVLLNSDLVKFADYQPKSKASFELLERAKDLIKALEHSRPERPRFVDLPPQHPDHPTIDRAQQDPEAEFVPRV